MNFNFSFVDIKYNQDFDINMKTFNTFKVAEIDIWLNNNHELLYDERFMDYKKEIMNSDAEHIV